MNQQKRHDEIIRHLKSHKFLSINELSKRIYSSYSTIRRDLISLEKSGQIKRVRGGAMFIPNPEEMPFHYREILNHTAKSNIAKEALLFLKDSETITLDSSSTCVTLARFLTDFNNLNIFTNGVKTAEILAENNTQTIHLTGGTVSKGSLSMLGSKATLAAQNYYSNIFFVSGKSISPLGILDSKEEEAQLKNVFADRTSKVIALIDSSKFNLSFNHISVPIDKIDILITDDKLPDNLRKTLKENNIEVLYTF